MKYKHTIKRPSFKSKISWLETSFQSQIGWMLWIKADFKSNPLIGDLASAFCPF